LKDQNVPNVPVIGFRRVPPVRRILLLVAAILPTLIFGNHATGICAEQQSRRTNPLAGDQAAIKEGYSLFRYNCALCHGSDARGGDRGPDLTLGRWVHGESDEDIFQTITKGVPGTQMPANDLSDEETWAIVAYLRSVSEKPHKAAGNPELGKEIFWGKAACGQCHMINGKGGRLGPDLSGIGAARSIRYLVDSIRDPSKDLASMPTDPNQDPDAVYDTVTVVTKQGQRFTGVAKNEDTFSIQLMDQREQLHFFTKDQLKEVIHERKSLMPAYDTSVLSDKELQDLVAYLAGLLGPQGSPEQKAVQEKKEPL
jgi:cytochrome c oxidase cbb3-type subunit III